MAVPASMRVRATFRRVVQSLRNGQSATGRLSCHTRNALPNRSTRPSGRARASRRVASNPPRRSVTRVAVPSPWSVNLTTRGTGAPTPADHSSRATSSATLPQGASGPTGPVLTTSSGPSSAPTNSTDAPLCPGVGTDGSPDPVIRRRPGCACDGPANRRSRRPRRPGWSCGPRSRGRSGTSPGEGGPPTVRAGGCACCVGSAR